MYDGLPHKTTIPGRGADWAIVLAGGPDTTLGGLTSDLYGYERPKQFCALMGRSSLLEETMARVATVVSDRRIIVSTTQRWRAETWECLHNHPGALVVEQPSNAGTTVSVLTALLHVLAADGHARVLVVPSDHYVSNGDAFMATAMAGATLVATDPRIVLLGAVVAQAEQGLGWIRTIRAPERLPWLSVRSVVDRPDANRTCALHAEGALANIHCLVARGTVLAGAIARRAPTWWRAATGAHGRADCMDRVFSTTPPSDLYCDVLQPLADTLRTMPLAGSTWSDLATPARLELARAGLSAGRPGGRPAVA